MGEDLNTRTMMLSKSIHTEKACYLEDVFELLTRSFASKFPSFDTSLVGVRWFCVAALLACTTASLSGVAGVSTGLRWASVASTLALA
jgi:hypothetical protein